MLNKLFNLVPPRVVRYIGNKSFASLQERGEIKTWMVGYTKNSSLLHSREGEDEDNDGDDGDFGADSKQVSLTWEQILNDDHDYENCDYDEAELDRKMAADEEAWQFDGFTS